MKVLKNKEYAMFSVGNKLSFTTNDNYIMTIKQLKECPDRPICDSFKKNICTGNELTDQENRKWCCIEKDFIFKTG